MARKKVKADEEITNTTSPIIGKYKGECADANITNNNGLDITKEVWEHVFSSDDYKQGIDKGWFIGYLGHPEDPGCMEFKDACIVMTEGHMDSHGKVYGEFNLIDTPVGRIVKTFQDAGVTFGISVRGAGDVINNSVEPESFVFRGFDLVSFPAFPESIPEFTAIAASTDANEKKKFEKICASVKSELSNITSTETIDAIQSQFPEQSEMYDELETRKKELEEVEPTLEDRVNLLEAQVDGLLALYADEVDAHEETKTQLEDMGEVRIGEQIKMSRRLHVIERICAAQMHDVEDLEDVVAAENQRYKNKVKILSSTNSKLKREVSSLENKLEKEQSRNLNYLKKIDSHKGELDSKDKLICSLQDKLDKTVIEASTSDEEVLNLRTENEDLTKAIEASEKIIAEYQDAYASLYSGAIGVNLGGNISVTAATSVSELQKSITAASSIDDISNSFQGVGYISDSDDDEDLAIC